MTEAEEKYSRLKALADQVVRMRTVGGRSLFDALTALEVFCRENP